MLSGHVIQQVYLLLQPSLLVPRAIQSVFGRRQCSQYVPDGCAKMTVLPNYNDPDSGHAKGTY